MRSNRDNRSDTEREIDDFLSQFDNPEDELSADVNSYLNAADTTRMTAARTFYGARYREQVQNESAAVPTDPAPVEPESVLHDAGTDAAVDEMLGDFAPGSDAASNIPQAADTASEAAPKHASHTASDETIIVEPKDVFAAASVAAAGAASASAAAGSANDKSNNKNGKSGRKNASAKSRKKSKKKAAGSATLGQKLFMKPNPKFDSSLPASAANKAMKFSFGKLVLDVIGLGVLCVLVFMIYALAIITTAPKYDFSDIYSEVDTSSMIYDDEGKQVDSVYYTQNRKVVSYSDMPENLINSFVSIEDKTFWTHHGFNWTRMIGAVLSSFTGSGRISGTSTITQQLARNVYLPDTKSERSIKRKILEMYYASRIEHSLSKEQIIEAYLNSVYFGYGCYGVDSAARTYFSKSVGKLSLVQCAALAALPQQPDNYALLKHGGDGAAVSDDSKVVASDPDTIVTNDLSKERRQLCLALMKDQGLITQDEYDDAVDKSLNSFIKPTISSGYGDNSYFHEYLVETVINDLMDQYGMEYLDAERLVYTRGLQIYSTLDSTAQSVIAKEFRDSSNFPSVSAIYNTDSDGNMLNNDGDIALYNYDHFFNDKGSFTLSGDEVKINKDGSVTVKKGHNLNIYETEVNGETDYSLEFKTYYRIIDGQLYSIQGGYINVPSAYKSVDSDGNLVISADYFTDHEGEIKVKDDKVVITKDAYSLSSPVLQPEGAMVVVGVGTGEVKAMVGGRSFRGQKLLNRALNPRQPGSSIKPLAVYGAALQKSYELASKGQKWTFIDFGIDKQGVKGWGDYVTVHSSIEDEKTHIENRDWPENVTRSFSGKNTFKTAIQQSINTCAVKLQLQVGADYSMNQLKKFGITTAVDDETQYANDVNPAALALGAMCEGVEPIEMALAYASFPGGGEVSTPVCYTRVVDRNGEVILEGKSTKTEAINEGVAFIMTDVLESVVQKNGYIHLDNGIQAGGKTGTTNEKYDLWFDGFTPSYAAALWIGTDQNVEINSTSYACAQLWGKIMNQIPKALTGTYPSQPANVISKGGEYFTSGTETGLTSYTNPEQEKKDREKAYKKWLKEREKHKTWVIDQEAVYEEQTVTERVKVGSHEEQVEDGTYQEQVGTDDDGNPIYETRTKYKTITVDDYEDRPTTKRVKISDEKGHWEYDSGYRDGDFKYKSSN